MCFGGRDLAVFFSLRPQSKGFVWCVCACVVCVGVMCLFFFYVVLSVAAIQWFCACVCVCVFVCVVCVFGRKTKVLCVSLRCVRLFLCVVWCVGVLLLCVVCFLCGRKTMVLCVFVLCVCVGVFPFLCGFKMLCLQNNGFVYFVFLWFCFACVLVMCV